MELIEKSAFMALAKSGMKTHAQQIDTKGFALVIDGKALASGTGSKKKVKLYKDAITASAAIMKEGIYNIEQPKKLEGVIVDFKKGGKTEAEKLAELKEKLKSLEEGLKKKQKAIDDTKKLIANFGKNHDHLE